MKLFVSNDTKKYVFHKVNTIKHFYTSPVQKLYFSSYGVVEILDLIIKFSNFLGMNKTTTYLIV